MIMFLAWANLTTALATSVALVALVLWQRGSGGGVSGLFGGGAQQAAASAAHGGRNLRRATAATGALWAASVLAAGVLLPALA